MLTSWSTTFYVYLVTEKSVVKKYLGCKWNDKMSFIHKVDLLVNQNCITMLYLYGIENYEL